MVNLKVFSLCDGTTASEDVKANLKKKKADSFCDDFTNNEKVIFDYCQEFEKEISTIPNEIKNLNSKSFFCSKEVIYEKLELEEINHKEKTGTSNYFSTRCKQYTNPFSVYNFEMVARGGPNKRIPIFDFHIKKMDDSSYEKMVID